MSGTEPTISTRQGHTAFWLDLTLTAIMAIAAVGTAWAGFQNTKWSGVQANAYADAGAARIESDRASTLGGQQRIIDLVTFTAWLEALNTEIQADPAARPSSPYTPEPGTISAFLFGRFRDEFTPAVRAWIATRPFVDPDAPPTPFVMPEYRLAEEAKGAQLAAVAEADAATARDANQRADNYVLTAVIFALVLFFAGIAGRARRARTQFLLFGFAALTLLGAIVTLATFPVQF